MPTPQELAKETARRRTFAIISHPDAGKTTITEKLLLFGQVIQQAGTVKGRGSDRHAVSDWMAMEKERGISVTTSVMQFPYKERMVNLLDTPGHEDFSEDTYRTLTAVDSALMVIDGAKGVEPRTIKLMEVCRLRTTPILTFINKLDRDTRDTFEVLDEIESILKIRCAPMNWPIGSGKRFKGVYDLEHDRTLLYATGQGHRIQEERYIHGIDNPELDAAVGDDLAAELREQIELVRGASDEFDLDAYRAGALTPVYFGTALGNFGVRELLDGFVEFAPPPQAREAETRIVEPSETEFSGFVFKIQANMDPNHRDRIAFLRVCAGHYAQGMKMRHVRINRDVQISNAVTFRAGERERADEAWPGDIIGLHNHGTIQIGDTFSAGEMLKFSGIPNFAPELFRRVILRDPLKGKQLQKGLQQLSEEGATQVFLPVEGGLPVLGAVGVLQFDVVAHRLKDEYKVEASYEAVQVYTARWVTSNNAKKLQEFEDKNAMNLSRDAAGALTYLAPTRANLQLTEERWPEISFHATREN